MMAKRVSWLVAAVSVVGAVTAAVLAVSGTPAGSVGVAPPWEPDPNALGSLTFYDANGTAVTHGDLGDHPSVFYAAASGPGLLDDSKAQLWLATPRQGVNPLSWSKDVMSASTDYPNTSAPPNVAALSTPVASPTPQDLSIADYVGEFPNDQTAAGWQGVYQFRLYTSSPTRLPGLTYYRADIAVNITDPVAMTGTWSVVYSPSPTTVTVSANPEASAKHGGTVTLTATVRPAGATGPANIEGAVEFFNGPDTLGLGAYDAATGTAVLTLAPTDGSYSYNAVFTSTDIGFAGSRSDPLRYRVGVVPPATAELTVSPASPQPSGASVTLTCAVRPLHVAGSVRFFDGTTDVGAGTYDPATGLAQLSVNPEDGGHSFTAMFHSDDPDHGNATTGSVPYTMIPPTVVTLSVSPAGGAAHGAAVTLTVLVSPAAPGRVRIFDGSHDVGSGLYDPGAGRATLSVTPADGTHSYKAQFLPAGSNTGPISVAVALRIDATAMTGTDNSGAVPVAPAAPVAASGLPTPSGSTGTSGNVSGSPVAYRGPTPTGPVGGALSSGSQTTAIAVSAAGVVALVGVAVLGARYVRRRPRAQYWDPRQ